MNRGWSLLSLSLLGTLVTGCLDSYASGDAWEGPYDAEGHGAAATEDEDADADAPRRDGHSSDDDQAVDPIDAKPVDEDDDLPQGDAECYGEGFAADGFDQCEADETWSAGCCWPTAMHACQALECGLEQCVILQSHPAQAACLPGAEG